MDEILALSAPPWTDASEDDSVDDVPDLPKKARTKPGQAWRLGDHVLHCGDCRTVELEPGKVDLVFTDPPYGINYRGDQKRVGDTRRAIENDSEDLAIELLDEAIPVMRNACRPGAVWYVCSPSGPTSLLFGIRLQKAGITRQRLIWAKDVLVLGRADYHCQHEDIYYGWIDGPNRRRPPDRKQTTIWSFPRLRRSEAHPTMKPVALVERAISNSSVVGDLVLDPFGGSGTTLIAAERQGRRSILIELDPRYCDVILDRWQQLTGGKAQRLTGREAA